MSSSSSLLSVVSDYYDGVTVDMKEPMDSAVFASMLTAWLSLWRQQGKIGVWIKLPLKFANLVGPAVQQGFRYHHAEPDYLTLVHWIHETTDTIPADASHRVGVISGAVVHPRRGVGDKEETRLKIPAGSEPKPIEHRKLFLPIIVQTSIGLATTFHGASGEISSEAKLILNVAAGSIVLGFIGCLAEILLGQKKKLNGAKNIAGEIISAATLFGFLATMGSIVDLQPALIIGLAGILTLVFSIAEFLL